ncbi:uncharacterized protein LOC115977553 [Quercus lobata]|uniref:uncharacterized protein LOC115977553 n=1 Tax=Quercus lobata TaxID=97700 RepID=UPI0012461515|nr:uncharacterized protein LOC115977553 [Quercus lobata]
MSPTHEARLILISLIHSPVSQARQRRRPMKLDSSSSLNSSLSFTLQSLKLVNVDSSTSSSLRSHLKPLKLTLSTSPARPSSTSPPSSSSDPRRRSALTHFSSADPLQGSLEESAAVF